jgi:hypothetical protein
MRDLGIKPSEKLYHHYLYNPKCTAEIEIIADKYEKGLITPAKALSEIKLSIASLSKRISGLYCTPKDILQVSKWALGWIDPEKFPTIKQKRPAALKSNGSKQPSNGALADKLFFESTRDIDLQHNLSYVKDYFEKRKKRGDYDRELAIKALTNIMLPVAKKDKSNHYSPATRMLAARLLMESIEAEGKSAVQRNPSKKVHLETALDELQKAYNHMSSARTAATRKSKEDRLVNALDSISRSMISFENAGEEHSDEYHQAKDLQSSAKMHMSSLK